MKRRKRSIRRTGPPLLVQFLSHVEAGRIVVQNAPSSPPNLGFDTPARVLAATCRALEAIWNGIDPALALGIPHRRGRPQWLDVDLAMRLAQRRARGDTWDAIHASCKSDASGELGGYLRERNEGIGAWLAASRHPVPEYQKMMKPACSRAALIGLHTRYSQLIKGIC